MYSKDLLDALTLLEIGFCCVAFVALIVRRLVGDYAWLAAFIALRATSTAALLGIHFYANGHPRSSVALYAPYYYTYWISFGFESVIALLVVYQIFRLAMEPLKGLQSLGMLVFKWAAGISVAVALGSAFHPSEGSSTYLTDAIAQLQRTQSILTLCLLLFVCFAVRPMGLSFRSRIFGISLGLGILSAMQLVQTAWMAFHPHLNTSFNLISGAMSCVVVGIWATYLVLPEPKQRLIVLPTTSPFLRWNQISQALGDSPGFVAVGGVANDLFAPAELEVLRLASLKMVTPLPESKPAEPKQLASVTSIASSASRAI